MAIKFYSDVTKGYYDDEVAAHKAEDELVKERNDKAARRKEAAKNVEEKGNAYSEAKKAYLNARKAYAEELSNFCKQYGAYHTTLSKADTDSLFESLWNEIFW